MRTWLQRLTPGPWVMRKVGMLGVLVGVGVAAFCWGRHGAAPRADANPPELGKMSILPASATAAPGTSDYNRRVVAYLYGNLAITREELGEYLIARFGAERLAFYIDRKIVEMECAGQGVVVTDGEVDVQFKEHLLASKLSEQDFTRLLKERKLSMYEWREDVIRPKLMLAKLVRPTVKVTPQDLQEAFEAKYGPKVQCRMIVLQKDNPHRNRVWERIRDGGRAAFLAEAKQQFIPDLAAREGEVPPIHRHFGDPKLEEAAFRLKEGEFSGILDMRDGSHVILLCEKHLAANATARFEEERMALGRHVEELKLAQAVPAAFQQMKQKANPNLILNRDAAQVTPVAGHATAIPAPPAAPAVPAPPAAAAVPPPGRAPSGN